MTSYPRVIGTKLGAKAMRKHQPLQGGRAGRIREMKTELQKSLITLRACSEAREWAAKRTAAQAWEECERADWLLWWASKTAINSHVDIVRAACACARSVLHLVKANEDRPLLAIEAAEMWASDPTPKNKAYAAATDAAYAAARSSKQKELCVLIRAQLKQPWTEE